MAWTNNEDRILREIIEYLWGRPGNHSWIYGFQYTIDPEGNTSFQEWGTPPHNRLRGATQPEAYTIDVDKERGIARVTIMVPTVNEPQVGVEGAPIRVQADGGEWVIPLGVEVEAEPVAVRWVNGVLEVELRIRGSGPSDVEVN